MHTCQYIHNKNKMWTLNHQKQNVDIESSRTSRGEEEEVEEEDGGEEESSYVPTYLHTQVNTQQYTLSQGSTTAHSCKMQHNRQ